MDSLLLVLVSTVFFSFLLYHLLLKPKSHGRLPLPPRPTGWPILGNIPQLGAKPHHTMHAFSKSYGPLFALRFGCVDVFVASSAAVSAEFLRTHDASFSDRPPNAGAEHVAYNYQDLVFAPYGPRWRMLRKLCNVHLFGGKALEGLRRVREGEVAALVGELALRGRYGDPVNLGRAVNVCATNALSRAAVGRRVFDADGGASSGEFKDMVVELMRLAGVFNVGDFVPWLKWLDPQGVVARMKALHRRYDEFLDGLLAEQRRAAAKGRQEEGEGRDILSVLIALKETPEEDGGKLSDVEIKALLLNLFTAGTDTTASTVEWAMAELVRNPDILKRAQDELDAVVGRDRLVSESDLGGLPVLQAIVKETFRLHPSTPLSLPRMATEAREVCGYHVPRGATLLVNVWAIARDPATWPDPLSFDPDRFLPGGSHHDVDIKGNDFQVIPFGAGRRICAGMSLGLRTVQLLTATLAHAFDWELPEGQLPEKIDMEEAYGLTLQRAVPLMVRSVPRLAPAAYQ